MKNPVIIKLLSVLLNLVAYILVSVITVNLNNGYDSGDNIFFIILTIPFAIILALLGGVVLNYFTLPSASAGPFKCFIIAFLFSLVWFFVTAALWGAAGNPLAFKSFYFWVMSGFFQLRVLDKWLPKKPGKIKLWQVLVGILLIQVVLIVFWVIILIVNQVYQNSHREDDRKAYNDDNSKNYLLLYNDTLTDTYGYKAKWGDIRISAGKYKMCFTDTFKTYAIVLKDTEGFVAISRDEEVMYHVFPFDNGPDYPSDGLFRIVENNKIGYADAESGDIVIAPQFDCAFPFAHGVARVSKDCKAEFNGEHSTWKSNHWFYIDKRAKKIFSPL